MLASWLYGFDDFLGERPAVGTEILDGDAQSLLYPVHNTDERSN